MKYSIFALVVLTALSGCVKTTTKSSMGINSECIPREHKSATDESCIKPKLGWKDANIGFGITP